MVAEVVSGAKEASGADDVNDLSRKISGSVLDEVVEDTVKNLKLDKMTDKTMKYVKKLVNANILIEDLLRITGIRSIGSLDATQEETERMIFKYLKKEFTRKSKPKPVDTEALIEQPGYAARIHDDKLVDCVSDFIINDLIENLKEDTTEHLTAYVSEYITEDILDEISAAYSEYLEKMEKMEELMDMDYDTSEDETPRSSTSNTDRSDITPNPGDSVIWEEFMDYSDDSSYGLPAPRVYERSIYNFVDFIENPIYVLKVPQKPKVEKLIADRVNYNLDPNVFIKIGDRWFGCISTLLKMSSAWFATKKWDIEFFEFTETDVPPSAFELIYEWIRFRTPVTLFNAVKVLQAARHLKIGKLENDCFKLISQPYVREKIGFKIFLEAEPLPLLTDVRDILLDRVRGYFLAMVGSGLIKDLKLDHLLSMLNRDTIGVNCEAEVFFSALRWLSKSEERLQHLETVMKCVRFPHLPMPMLFSLRKLGLEKEKKPIGTTERVMQEFQANPSLRQMIIDAMTHISLHVQSEQDGETMRRNDKDGDKLIRPRRWVYHPRCSYHKQHLVYPYQHLFTEDDFDKFVNIVQLEWLNDYPPPDNLKEVEFDGVVLYAPNLKPEE